MKLSRQKTKVETNVTTKPDMKPFKRSSMCTLEKFVKTEKRKCKKCKKETIHSVVYDKSSVRVFKRLTRLFKSDVIKEEPKHPGYTGRCTVCHTGVAIKANKMVW